MAKTKIALYDFTGCEGCEFHLLSLNEQLLDIFQDFEITNWRLLKENNKADFDIAIIEGAATTKEHINLLKNIRKTSKAVVALGACAITGNVFAGLNTEQRKKLAQKIYNKDYQLKAEFLEPIEKYIKVDYQIPGCPPDIEKFKQLLKQFKDKKITSAPGMVDPPDYVAKIEGHGNLKINFQSKKVFFEVEESERLVEGLLLNQPFAKAPFINARICGICPVAHNLCSYKALENALGVTVSPETIILRELMLCAQFIKSHLLHLFFLVLPDYAGLKNSLELATKYPAEFHLMLNIKRVAEKLLNIIAGSTAFPINTALGGFKTPPKIDDLLALQEEIYDVLDEAQDLIYLIADLKIPSLESKVYFLTINPPKSSYPLYQNKSVLKIKEIIAKNSTAKLGILTSGKAVKVGAMARMTFYAANLNPKAKGFLQELNPALENPYNNNLAQAIEIMHFLEEVIILIESLKLMEIDSVLEQKPKKLDKPVFGKAFLEAPRGVLHHRVKLGNDGKILNYNIIPPTQINLASLHLEAQTLIKQYADFRHQAIRSDIEKLIRAFDPCITCAVH